jgi:hypothetical protein
LHYHILPLALRKEGEQGKSRARVPLLLLPLLPLPLLLLLPLLPLLLLASLL